LTHYVRAGDFIENLVKAAQDLNEYAFALGALAHAAGDGQGHSIATNHAVAELYPKLRAKYGNVIPYEDNPVAHLKVEFGFDVSQVAHGNYAPDAYRDFIGFEISKPVLQRAFRETYGFEFDSMYFSVDLALGTYRYAVSSLIPLMTKVAWQTKRKDISQMHPGVTKKKFVYNLSRASFKKRWGNQYKRPGILARFLSVLFRLLPKVGPLRPFEFRPLTANTETIFAKSFNATLDVYRGMLRDVQSGRLQVRNLNFDTGKAVEPGDYRLADETYAKLVEKICEGKTDTIPAELRADILRYFAKGQGPQRLQAGLERLRNGGQ
jgi:hypothetical protein